MAERHNVLIVNQLVVSGSSDAANRPGLSFGDADTGIYQSVDDNMSFSVNGTETFKISGADVCFLANQRSTLPGSPSGGGYLWVSGGALVYVGSSGTFTRLAVP